MSDEKANELGKTLKEGLKRGAYAQIGGQAANNSFSYAQQAYREPPTSLASELANRKAKTALLLGQNEDERKRLEAQYADLDRAIAALSPAPSEGEGEDAPEIKIDLDGIDFEIPQAILDERVRQITVEGWTAEHDDVHTGGQMHAAAVAYYQHGTEKSWVGGNGVPVSWPWARVWWKPKDRRSNLVRAGALLLAERARLKREDMNLPSTYLLRNVCDELRQIDAPDTITISSSSQHAEESARAQDPLFLPEREQPATPEQLEATGVIDGEAGWWGRKLAKERA